jgi:hypothetical protein
MWIVRWYGEGKPVGGSFPKARVGGDHDKKFREIRAAREFCHRYFASIQFSDIYVAEKTLVMATKINRRIGNEVHIVIKPF